MLLIREIYRSLRNWSLRSSSLPLPLFHSAMLRLGCNAHFLRNEPIFQRGLYRRSSPEIFTGDPGDVHVYGHGRRYVALGAGGSLEALQFVIGLVEPPLYLCLVAGELREGGCCVCIPDKGSAECGGLRVLLGLYLLGLGESLLVLLFVCIIKSLTGTGGAQTILALAPEYIS